MDDANQATFARYFMAGQQPAGYPPRAGYYVRSCNSSGS